MKRKIKFYKTVKTMTSEENSKGNYVPQLGSSNDVYPDSNLIFKNK